MKKLLFSSAGAAPATRRHVALRRWTKKWLWKQTFLKQISIRTMQSALEILVQQGITSQRKQLLQYVAERGGRFTCLKCQQDGTAHAGWGDFNQDNVSHHFKQKHRDITIYTPDQFQNARKRRHENQPPITSKFQKVEYEHSDGVQFAVDMLRKHPGMPLSYFDSPVFLLPWKDSKGVNAKNVIDAVMEADKKRSEFIKNWLEAKLMVAKALPATN